MVDRQPPASQSEKKEKSYAEFETAANELLERSRQLLEAAASYSSKLKAEGDAIGSQATALGKDIKALQTEVSKAADRDEISIDEAEKVWCSVWMLRPAAFHSDRNRCEHVGLVTYPSHRILQSTAICASYSR